MTKEYYIKRTHNKTGLIDFFDFFSQKQLWHKDLDEYCLIDDKKEAESELLECIKRHSGHIQYWYEWKEVKKSINGHSYKTTNEIWLGNFFHEYDSNFTITLEVKNEQSQ